MFYDVIMMTSVLLTVAEVSKEALLYGGSMRISPKIDVTEILLEVLNTLLTHQHSTKEFR